MTMASIATAIAIGVGTNLISKKIIGDPKMPKQIGTGTAPSLTPGPETEIQDITGSTVQDFDEFTSTDFTTPSQADQDMIMAELEKAGVSLEDLQEFGIPGMYVGGLVRKMSNGGSFAGLASLINDIPILSMLNNYMPDLSMNLDPADIDVPMPELSRYEEFLAKFAELDPKVQEAVTEGLGSIGSTTLMKLFDDDDDPGMSRVSTRTLPPAGNANRRRLQFNPIGMNNGGATGKTLSDADMNQVIEMLAMANTQQGRRISDKDREYYSQLLEGATLSDLDIANLLAQPTTQMGKMISNKDREYQMSLLKGMEGGGVLDRKMFKPMLGGGELDGPGGPKDDLIPVMASDGEFMLSKATVDLVGGGNHNKGIAALEKLNNRGNRVYG